MRKVVILGGGAWVPQLASALHGFGARGIQLRLYARDWQRLEQVHARCPQLPGLEVQAFSFLEAALEGAEVVVLLIRVGGSAARAWDERFPTTWDQVGDEGLGLGGLANAWRTVPVLVELSATLRACAPQAWVLNMVAPLGVTTRVLHDAGLRAIGLCELPARVEEQLGGAGHFDYAGYNHAGWFWPKDAAGQRIVSGLVAHGELDEHTWRRLGAVPLPYFYDVLDPASGSRIGRPPKRTGRAQSLAKAAEAILSGLPSTRPTPWFDLALAPALGALLDNDPWMGWANIPLPDVVHEVRALWDVHGVHPQRVPPVPPAVADWLRAHEVWERAAWEAATSRDPNALVPAVAHLIPDSRVFDQVIGDITAPIEEPS